MSAPENEERAETKPALMTSQDTPTPMPTASTESPQSEKKSGIQFETMNGGPNPTKDAWAEVVQRYRDKYKGESLKGGSEGSEALSFDSEEEAVRFFSQCANDKLVFAAKEVDGRGNPTGNYMISLGDGQLIQGKVDPKYIDKLASTYKAWLSAPEGTQKDALADEIRNFETTAESEHTVTVSSTADMRSKISSMKSGEPSVEPGQSSRADSSESSTPNPLRTTPKPK